jgi:hypothetical protein
MKALFLLAAVDALCIWSIRGRAATLSEQPAAALVDVGQVEGAKECGDLAREGRKLVRKDIGLGGTRVNLQVEDLCAQGDLDNQVGLLAALDAGIESLMTDGRDPQSPVATAKGILGTDDTEAAMKLVREALARPGSSIRLMSLDEQPEGGESIDANWILEVEIPELGDTTFWAVIDRSGAEATYNYGFN